MTSIQQPRNDGINRNEGVQAPARPEISSAQRHASAPAPGQLPQADTKGIFDKIKASFSTHVAKPIRDIFTKEILLPEGSKRKFSLTGAAVTLASAVGKYAVIAARAPLFPLGYLIQYAKDKGLNREARNEHAIKAGKEVRASIYEL